jgi:hypothetical protein
VGAVPLTADEWAEVRATALAIARAEIASLAGLALRRGGEPIRESRSFERNVAADVARDAHNEFWGEVLRDFGATPADPGL